MIKIPGPYCSDRGFFPLGGVADAALGGPGGAHLHEAADIGSDNIVDISVGLGAVLYADRVDVVHDGAQAGIHLFGCPGQAHGVLAHLESRGGDTSGVGRLARGVEQAVLLEDADRLGRRGHVRSFGDAAAAVGHEFAGILAVEFVLRGARHGDVALHAPRALARIVGGRRIAVGIFADAAAEDVLELHDIVELLGRDALGIVDVARRVGERYDFGPQCRGLLAGILGHVARAGDRHGLSPERVAARGEHLLGEVADAVSRGFGTQRAAAPVAALARERSGELVAQPLVLPEEEADLTASDTDVAGRDVGVLADMALELGHERLAELHHLVVRLAFGIEVRAALAAAHREGREAVFEGLLEGQELQDREVHRGVEADAALVGADGAVHLHAVAAVDLDLAPVIEPRHAEDDHAFGFGNAFENLHLLKNGAGHDVWGERFGNFADRLVELRFARIAGDEPAHELFDVLFGLFIHRKYVQVESLIGFRP